MRMFLISSASLKSIPTTHQKNSENRIIRPIDLCNCPTPRCIDWSIFAYKKMNILLQITLIGIGATAIMDSFTFLLRCIGIQTLDYKYVGRWVGHLWKGRFTHSTIFTANPIKHEKIIGWTAHYAIGISFAFLLVYFDGVQWLDRPRPVPALVVGILTTIAPFFIMQPSFGIGWAASKTPNPNKARLMSIIIHLVYGIGLYLSALLFKSIAM